MQWVRSILAHLRTCMAMPILHETNRVLHEIRWWVHLPSSIRPFDLDQNEEHNLPSNKIPSPAQTR